MKTKRQNEVAKEVKEVEFFESTLKARSSNEIEVADGRISLSKKLSSPEDES